MRRIEGHIVVVKVGTQVLVPNGEISSEIMGAIASQISRIYNQGWCPVIVSSGAIACANWHSAMKDVTTQQIKAMIGQPILMNRWQSAFGRYDLLVLQGLATHCEFRHEETIGVLERTLQEGLLPILNENDFVSFEEIRALEQCGDNDALAAIVAQGLRAKVLILLSDVDGLKDDQGNIIPCVLAFDERIKSYIDDHNTSRPTGMRSKLNAAQAAAESGVAVWITNGRDTSAILDILEGKQKGTIVTPG